MKSRKFKRQSDQSTRFIQKKSNPDCVYFGFVEEYEHDEFLKVINSEKSAPCMVRQVTEEVLDEMNELNIEEFKIGQWLISTGSCENLNILGPFETMEDAFNHGHKHLGVKRYSTAPQLLP